ncbi:MAG: HAD-IIIC family phosphatase [Byssovorax sp.]
MDSGDGAHLHCRQVHEIVFAASFTADPVIEVVSSWLDQLGLAAALRSAPYGQVFQALLDPGSALASPEAALRVLVVRPSDLGGAGESAELGRAIRAFTARVRGPCLIGLTPAPPGRSSRDEERVLAEVLADLPEVEVVPASALLSLHPVAEVHDRHGDALGHLPYTGAFFAALGTLIARRIHALLAPPYKVIAVDCDQTLWSGVAGEDGPLGVVIDPARRAIQRILIEQRAAGMLLCLVSKNEPADVEAALAEHPDMLLRAAHVAARRISWRPKAEGLRAIAAELGLGLDAFVFLDDDPVERAAVRAACPEVLVPELPRDPAAIPRMLRHLWAFDHLRVTTEDRARSAFYEAAGQRAHAAREAPSLAAFLESLALEVMITPLAAAEIARAGQLARRTNQLNASGRRWGDAELAAAIEGGAMEGRIVRARDRFGDYGIVGLMLFAARGDALFVDTFLLSCRALGRGVEAEMLVHLGRLASERGLAAVEVGFVPTERSRPAHALLERACPAACEAVGDAVVFRYMARELAGLRLDPVAEVPAEPPPEPASAPPGGAARSRTLARIAEGLGEVPALLDALGLSLRRPRRAAAPYVAPRTPIEERLAAIVAEVLRVEPVGVHDGFFELGGQSIDLIRAVSQIRDALGVDLAPETFFAGPTIAHLAEALDTPARAAPADVDALLDELDALSDEEARALLDAPPIEAPRAPAPSGEEGASIALVGIITRSRPEALGRAIESYLGNARRFGRRVALVIADDTPSAGDRAACRAELGRLSRRHGVPIHYAGAEEKAAFAAALIERGLPPSAVRFAILPEAHAASTAGANRNALLLHTAGEAFFDTDDDTVCRLFRGPREERGLALAAGVDPADCWFHEDRAAAIASVVADDRDLLGLHEAMLGRSAARLVAALGPVDPRGAEDAFRRRIEAGSGRVIMSFNGLVGDCGWGPPFGYWRGPMGYLAMRGASLARMTASEAIYRSATESREIVRLVDRPCLADAEFSMTTFAAIDNRRPLPPFMSLGRGQDNVFGTTVELCFPEAFFGHLPWALLHEPVEKRRYWPGEMARSAGGVDIGRLTLECLRSWVPGVSLDPDERMRSLGRHLGALGALSQPELDAFLLGRLRATGEAFLGWLDRRRAEEGYAPPFWDADMRRYRDALCEAMERPDYGIPLDVRGDAAATRARAILGRFGEVIACWPDLVREAIALREAGRGLAVKVAG